MTEREAPERGVTATGITDPSATSSAADAAYRGSLAGARVLVTRGGAAAERDAEVIAEFGGVAIAVPLTEIVPPTDPEALAEAAAAWNRGDYDWLIVTSANAADAFAAAGATVSGSAGLIAAVGPATAEALAAHGLDPALVPATDYSGAGVAAAVIDRIAAETHTSSAAPHGARVLLPVSEIADRTVESALETAGHSVTRVTAYRSVAAAAGEVIPQLIADGKVDVVLVLSGAAARELARRVPELADPVDTTATAPRPLIAAIGGPTARALAELGLAADVVADPHTVANLLARVAHAREFPLPHLGGAPA
ncbi:uroporphyrinogen-III synthase [Leucobacter musarum]|uniref:uroporphyrinogen-III synthase n=1 Tax=Leucobacter musarum TaxID=1930747 RepID=UPI0006A77E62|nr:uroporphyrinogen-III synthase [Leucobacter musarum]